MEVRLKTRQTDKQPDREIERGRKREREREREREMKGDREEGMGREGSTALGCYKFFSASKI